VSPLDVIEGRARWCVLQADNRDVLPTLPRVDAVVTDPPYGINANKQTLGAGKRQFERGGDWDAVAPAVAHFLGLARVCVIWGGNYFNDLPTSNDWLCWHKKNDGRSFSEFELAWSNTGKNCRHLSHHWSGEEKEHPTAKPLDVMLWTVGLATDPNDIVLDPFCGSGTTGVACLRLGRRFIGIEREESFARLAHERMQAESQGLTLCDVRAGQLSLLGGT
jgi:site-specific DNA-methyltransferase (adenine-specific)